MSGYADKMHALLEGQELREMLLADLHECLEAVGVVVEAPDDEALVSGVSRVLEAYELPENTVQQLHEIIGTLLALGAGYHAGKWLHNKYKDWQHGRAQKQYAAAQRDYDTEVMRHHANQLRQHANAIASGAAPPSERNSRYRDDEGTRRPRRYRSKRRYRRSASSAESD